jgi:hypothetical protein
MDRTKLAHIADGLAVALAVSLPLSTSATSILGALWLLAVIPSLNWSDMRRELLTPAGGLPVLLFLLGLLGMAWADVSLVERWNGFDSFLKLPAIPLLIAQFRHSERGSWVLGGYLASCVALLVTAVLVRFVPPFTAIPTNADGLLAKNIPTQSGEFVTCIFGLLFLALETFRRRQWLWVTVMAGAAFGMLIDIIYRSIGRTALVTIPVLLVLFAIKKLDYRGVLILLLGATVLSATAWYSSPYLRKRTEAVWIDFKQYEKADEQNSSGERIEFAKKSFGFVLEAPVFGHGTGTIHALFEMSSRGHTGAAGSATTNPHNQTFAVAIQLGLIGALVLWAMWIAHLLLFRGDGLAQWVGLVVVTQNIVGSLFNSHLFDFTQGWVYVVGVGVAGGMVLQNRSKGIAGGP